MPHLFILHVGRSQACFLTLLGRKLEELDSTEVGAGLFADLVAACGDVGEDVPRAGAGLLPVLRNMNFRHLLTALVKHVGPQEPSIASAADALLHHLQASADGTLAQ